MKKVSSTQKGMGAAQRSPPVFGLYSKYYLTGRGGQTSRAPSIFHPGNSHQMGPHGGTHAVDRRGQLVRQLFLHGLFLVQHERKEGPADFLFYLSIYKLFQSTSEEGRETLFTCLWQNTMHGSLRHNESTMCWCDPLLVQKRLLCLSFFKRVFLGISGRSPTDHNPPFSTFWELWLHECIVMPSLKKKILVTE